MMRQQYYGIDLLRIFACFLVLLLHSCECFYMTFFCGVGSYLNLDVVALKSGFNYPTIDTATVQSESICVVLFESLTRCAVPIFVMISGFLLLPLKSCMTMGAFYRKRVSRILLPLVSWTIVYSLYTTFLLESGHDGVGDYLYSIFKGIGGVFVNFPNHFGHLWYVYMILGLYIIIPILSPWVERASRPQMIFVLSIWILTLFLPFIRSVWTNVWGECPWNPFGTHYYFSGFIGYLLLGAYIRKFIFDADFNCQKWGVLFVSIGFMSAVGLIIYQVSQITSFDAEESYMSIAKTFDMSLSYCSVPMFLQATGFFLLCFKLPPQRMPSILLDISHLSYGIYLCHMIFLTLLCENVFISLDLPTSIRIIGICLSTMLVSYLLTKILSRLPYSRCII